LDARLADIFCYEHERTVSRDYVVRFEKRLFQILKGNKALPRPKSKVIVRVLLDGTLRIIWKGTKLLVKEQRVHTVKIYGMPHDRRGHFYLTQLGDILT